MTQPNEPRPQPVPASRAPAGGPANPVPVIVELIDHTSRIAELNQRGDLAERLRRAKARITDPQIRVVIAGHLKQGKSLLPNALRNIPAPRVGDDESTVL